MGKLNVDGTDIQVLQIEEDDYRITIYLNPKYVMDKVNIKNDGQQFNNFYTSKYP